MPKETRVVTWMMGRDNKVVTWDLGKIGVLASQAQEIPRPTERWVVQIIRDTAPGERRGVLVLDPVRRLADSESAEVPAGTDNIDESAVENMDALVELAVVCLCPDAVVHRSRDGAAIRYRLAVPDDQSAKLVGLDGKVIESLRAFVREVATRAGVRVWLDVDTSNGNNILYASCDCGEEFDDIVDYEDNTTPGGAEDRFEDGRPVRYPYRLCCRCGRRVYTQDR